MNRICAWIRWFLDKGIKFITVYWEIYICTYWKLINLLFFIPAAKHDSIDICQSINIISNFCLDTLYRLHYGNHTLWCKSNWNCFTCENLYFAHSSHKLGVSCTIMQNNLQYFEIWAFSFTQPICSYSSMTYISTNCLPWCTIVFF